MRILLISARRVDAWTPGRPPYCVAPFWRTSIGIGLSADRCQMMMCTYLRYVPRRLGSCGWVIWATCSAGSRITDYGVSIVRRKFDATAVACQAALTYGARTLRRFSYAEQSVRCDDWAANEIDLSLITSRIVFAANGQLERELLHLANFANSQSKHDTHSYIDSLNPFDVPPPEGNANCTRVECTSKCESLC